MITVINDVIRDTVALIELNHFFDDNGNLVFDQLIFYDWTEDLRGAAPPHRHNVRAWVLVKSPAIVPVFDWKLKMYRAMWTNGDVTRVVYSNSYSETWTQYDPELAEREKFPKEFRRELTPVRIPSVQSDKIQ